VQGTGIFAVGLEVVAAGTVGATGTATAGCAAGTTGTAATGCAAGTAGTAATGCATGTAGTTATGCAAGTTGTTATGCAAGTTGTTATGCATVELTTAAIEGLLFAGFLLDIVIVTDVAAVAADADIGANMLVEEQPAIVFIYEVGAVTFPQTTHTAFAAGAAADVAGSEEGSSGTEAVVSYFNDIGCQSVHGNFHQGSGVKAADLGEFVKQAQPALESLAVVQSDGTVPNGIPASHTAESVCPGSGVELGHIGVAVCPDAAPFFGGPCFGMEISMGSMAELNFLSSCAVMDTFGERKISIHYFLPPWNLG